VLAFDDLNDSAFSASVWAAAFDTREDVIAMHGIARAVAPDVDIAIDPRLRLGRHDEAIAVAMRNKASRY
jgi:hypothetical protein